ncbi:hypothetical protein, partial [Shewanella algae]|uniref:hypothetical protein n=1 Tax=Shewanella algae TaxID=38313 RepID=UPI00313B0746
MSAPVSTGRRRAADPAPRSRAIAAGLYTAVSAVLAVLAAWPVYASPAFVVLVAVAVPVAAGAVVLARWRRWGGWITAAVVAGAFTVLAVPLAVPSRSGAPLDILRGLGEAFSGVLLAWKDL